MERTEKEQNHKMIAWTLFFCRSWILKCKKMSQHC